MPGCVEKQRAGLSRREEDDELSDRCYDEDEEDNDSLSKTWVERLWKKKTARKVNGGGK